MKKTLASRVSRKSKWLWGKIPVLMKTVMISTGCLVAACGLLFVIIDQLIYPLPTNLLTRPSSTFVYSREGKLLKAFTSSDYFWRMPVSLDQISSKLIKSVLTTEDKYYYQHPGVNPFSIVSSAWANIKAGKIVRGGSTITMQIARMIEPKERTIPNKLKEIFRAFQLELQFTKTELLETYFNIVPYGGNIEGIGAAAHFYFDKKPTELSWSEATLLTAIPGSPERFRPDRYLFRGKKRSEFLLDNLKQKEIISLTEYNEALAEEIPSQRLVVPSQAPHFTESLRSEYSDSVLLYSTIKYEVQEICNRLARSYHSKYSEIGIHNLAMVVIDNDRSEIVGLLGSPDFNDQLHSGQVNASIAPRSPGSALKPFVYGLAFDYGLLSPEMMVADIPVNYNGYKPVNYDELNRGVISIREALINSLNIPAVNIASEVKLHNLHDLLRRGGLSSIDNPYNYYGLPIILGACEVRLTELTNLYASLARQGVYKPVKSLMGEEDSYEVRLFSSEASYLLSDILVDLKRPDLPESWQTTKTNTPVAWKTGTSYGRRDAWAVGYTPKYTIGVWAGNCAGEGSIDIVGVAIAAPVMFDLFSNITKESAQQWFDKPDDIGERYVCSASGQPLGRFCENKISENFIIGKSPGATCSVHRPIFVNVTNGQRISASCTGSIPFIKKVIEIWPPQIASWLVNNNMIEPLPQYDPLCISVSDGLKPSIISPENGSVFEFVAELPAEYQKIRLQASISTGDGEVHWFIDGKHLTSALAGDLTFYVPEPGIHTLLCMDNAGRSSTSKITIN